MGSLESMGSVESVCPVDQDWPYFLEALETTNLLRCYLAPHLARNVNFYCEFKSVLLRFLGTLLRNMGTCSWENCSCEIALTSVTNADFAARSAPGPYTKADDSSLGCCEKSFPYRCTSGWEKGNMLSLRKALLVLWPMMLHNAKIFW